MTNKTCYPHILIIGDRIMCLSINHSYMVKPLIFITYQYIFEWFYVFVLGFNIVDF